MGILMSLYRRISIAIIVLALLVSGFILISASSVRAGASGGGMIRLVHASPDVGMVDVFVDRVEKLRSFAYASVTGYLPLEAGAHKLQIALIGKGVDAAVMTQTFTVANEKAYTVVALGTNTSGFSLQMFEDNNFIENASGAKVRVYQLSPWATSISARANTTKLVDALIYPKASAYSFIPAGTYTVSISVPTNATPLSTSITLKSEKVTSIFTIGDMGSTARIRIVSAQVNAIPGMPNTGSDPDPVRALHSLPIFSQLIDWLVHVLGLNWV